MQQDYAVDGATTTKVASKLANYINQAEGAGQQASHLADRLETFVSNLASEPRPPLSEVAENPATERGLNGLSSALDHINGGHDKISNLLGKLEELVG